MPWEIDVRKGTAMVGATRREGYTVMRDREKRLISFHVTDERSQEWMGVLAMRETDQFVVDEDSFVPA
jgi:hypothetical protein